MLNQQIIMTKHLLLMLFKMSDNKLLTFNPKQMKNKKRKRKRKIKRNKKKRRRNLIPGLYQHF